MGGEIQDRGQSTLQRVSFTLEFSDPKKIIHKHLQQIPFLRMFKAYTIKHELK